MSSKKTAAAPAGDALQAAALEREKELQTAALATEQRVEPENLPEKREADQAEALVTAERRLPAAPQNLKVRAILAGYIGNGPLGMIYRNPGDVFILVPREIPLRDGAGKPVLDPDTQEPMTRILTAAQQFSHKWMERVPDEVPEQLTTAQAALDRQSADLL